MRFRRNQKRDMNNFRDPLHGLTLKTIVTELVNEFGWKTLAEEIKADCFIYDPSINSSLKFLRKNLPFRIKVEKFYIEFKRSKA